MKNTLFITAVLLFFALPDMAQPLKSRSNEIRENKHRKTERRERKYSREQEENESEENDEYDGPDKAALFEFNKTKDPSLGRVPKDRLLFAIDRARRSKQDRQSTNNNISSLATTSLSWTERGPYADVVGPSNGNTRANSVITAGRVRAIMVDSGDQTHKTVWVAGVDGGLWKTTDITASPATWAPVNDFLNNLAITDICQDPTNINTMYFCTGEAYYNGDAVQGLGVFKSTDHGATWTQLPSTSSYTYCTRILCDYQGYVYLATRGNGLLRSKDNGSTWTNITPSGLSLNICDLEISSTATAARLHMVAGIFSTQAYRYTDIPGTVTSSSGWTAPTTAFPSYSMRAEIACMGNALYALPADNSYQVPTIYKSTNGGADWTATVGQPTSGWASGQGWYALAASINPANTNECIVGGLDTWKTTDGGTTWTKISAWVGTTGQYVHADVHKILWFDNGSKLLFGCDGGIHFSSDGGATISDRNSGLRIKQFYSCAIHPTSTNYMLAGAQDNGTHQLNAAGLASSVEVVGGDGAFVAIDATDPQYQFGAYVYGNFRRSTNSGSGWSSINFYEGSSTANQMGQFINAYALDDSTETIYAGAGANEFFRWTTATTTASGNYYSTGIPAFPAGASIVSGITAFGGGKASALKVSPYTLNRVFFGTTAGRIVRIDTAYTAATSNPTAVNITGSGMPTGYVSSIEVGTSDSNLIVCFANYGVRNIWVSTNAGASWTAIDSTLPDMPVRWAMFYPGDNTRAIIATEAGVWTTDLINGASTAWNASSSFPVVRTDMLKYRSSDQTLVAATHGRGLWTTTVPQLTCAPAASTILASSNTVCSGTGTTLSLSQAYGTTNYTFQWMSATSSGGTYSNLSTAATQSTGNLSATTYYKCMITCITTSSSFTTPEFSVTVSQIPAAPSGTGGSRCGTGTVSLSATPPSGATVAWYAASSGGSVLATTTSYTTPSISATTTYYVESQVGSTCVSTTRTPVTATVNAAPAVPASITITSVIDTCGGRIYRYSTPVASAPATGYQWSFTNTTLGNNAAVDSGSLTGQVVRIKFSSNSAAVTGDSVRVLYTSSTCNSSNRASLLTNTLLSAPAAPASITITSVKDTCNGRIYRYTTPAITGTAKGYQWSFVGTLYGTASLDSGTLTSQTLKLKYTSNAAAGTDSARVAYTSGCGTGTRRALKLTNTALAAPTAPASITITSVKDTCNGRVYRYTTPALAGTATGYQWSFVGSLYGTASLDSGTLTSKTLKVKYTSNAAAGTDSARVAYTSGCGTSTRRALKLTNTALAAPAAPASITITSVKDTCNGRIYRYTTPALTGTATGYQWSFVGTLYNTASIDSGSLTSQTLKVKFTSNAVAGTDSARVSYTSGCGTSTRRALKLTNTALAAPATAPAAPVITLVSTTGCTRVYRYSTTSTLTGTATGYLWSFVGTLGSTATLDSGTLTSRVVRMSFTSAIAAGTDSARVVFTSGCGNSPIARTKLTNTLLTCTPVIGGSPNTTYVSTMDGGVKVKVYPNPSLGLFNVQVQSPNKDAVFIKVVDMQGRLLKEIKTTPYKMNIMGADLLPGLYIMEVSQGKYKSSVKVIKE